MTSLDTMQKTTLITNIRNDGGWIHYRVTDKEQLANAQTMLAVKCGSVKER